MAIRRGTTCNASDSQSAVRTVGNDSGSQTAVRRGTIYYDSGSQPATDAVNSESARRSGIYNEPDFPPADSATESRFEGDDKEKQAPPAKRCLKRSTSEMSVPGSALSKNRSVVWEELDLIPSLPMEPAQPENSNENYMNMSSVSGTTGHSDPEASGKTNIEAELKKNSKLLRPVKDKFAAARLASREKCLSTFRQLLVSKEGPSLRTWFQYFDKPMSGKIGQKEFRHGMFALRYPHSIDDLWAELNCDGSDEFFFDEVEGDQSVLWNQFRRWAGSKFENPRDMFKQIKKAAAASDMSEQPGLCPIITRDALCQLEFVYGIRQLDWTLKREEMIFGILEMSGDGTLSIRDLRWMDAEARRVQVSIAARKRTQKLMDQKARNNRQCALALADFKVCLVRQYGILFRAWRRALDVDGSMTLLRAELFKACRTINWQGNMRTLWKALDYDNSGATTFEELDPWGARMLAEFRCWASSVWGPKMAVPMFREFDKKNKNKLSYSEFSTQCEARGYSAGNAMRVAQHLDWNVLKYVREVDFLVLDTWRPPDWLIAEPNHEAAEEFKSALLAKYGHYVRAWRCCMDKDNTNSCNWHDFNEAAKRIKYKGDIAGAWVAFDSDISGYISLCEIDSESYELFTQFKEWADKEFGGVRAAFRAIDVDKSGAITFREFRSVCRSYGYAGDTIALYESFDQHGNKHVLSYDEVAFLEEWILTKPNGVERDEELEVAEPRRPPEIVKTERYPMPGPGAYDISIPFGCSGETGPIAGVTFGHRLRKVWSKTRVGPVAYNPKYSKVLHAKPAWTFGPPSGPPAIDFSQYFHALK